MNANVRNRSGTVRAFLAVACLVTALPARTTHACTPTCPVSVELPASGPGFVAIGRADRRFGTAELIYPLQDAARTWQNGAVKPGGGGKLAINEISQRCGGDIGHLSHKCGTDVDIGPLQTYPNYGFLDIRGHEPPYSPGLTNWFIKVTARDANMKPIVVFFNDSRLWDSLVKQQDGHYDHFHMRIQAPPSVAQCCTTQNCGP